LELRRQADLIRARSRAPGRGRVERHGTELTLH
jgi:hypothetical protein